MSFKFDIMSQKVQNYLPPPPQFADKPQKKIKFVVKKKKSPVKDPEPQKKKKIKFVKKKKSPVKDAEPQKKKKIKFVKKPKSELEKRTGLKKEKANKLEPLALFGQLPQELRKNILTPKKTGVKVGGYKAKDILSDIKSSDEYYERKADIMDNLNQYAYQYQDYDDYIEKSRDRKFFDKVNKYIREPGNYLTDLREKDIFKYEEIEEEVRDKMSEEAHEIMETQLGVWAETQGNTTGSLEYFIRSFDDHMLNY